MTELRPGEKFDLMIGVRDALSARYSEDDIDLLLRQYQIHAPDWGALSGSGQTLGEVLDSAANADLINLAQFMGVRDVDTPSEKEAAPLVDVDAYSELVSAETALRDVVRLGVPDWLNQLDEPAVKRLEEKRTAEQKKRDGVVVSGDLLDYTEVHQLEKLVLSNWNGACQPILDDKKRTEVYLGIITDIRNTIGHSRRLVRSERYLLAGATGQIRNQLARYRGNQDGSVRNYSSIDSARDSFNADGAGDISFYPIPATDSTSRLQVGDVITFDLEATDPRNRELNWAGYLVDGNYGPAAYSMHGPPRFEISGSPAQGDWHVTEDDVGEGQTFVVILSNGGRYQRRNGIDDARQFVYHVDPPPDDAVDSY